MPNFRAFGLSASRLVDPLLVFVVLMGVALWFWTTSDYALRRERVARTLAWLCWAGLWIFSCPAFEASAVKWLQPPIQDIRDQISDVVPSQRALVILGGGLQTDDERIAGPERLSGAAKGRVLGAARIYHAYGFGHVIVTDGWDVSAQAMVEFLVLLGVPRDRIHVDAQAVDTKGNAADSIAMARSLGVDRLVIVTSALHMRRSLWEFERHGMKVVAAPVDFVGGSNPWSSADAVLPSAHAFAQFGVVVHEVLGRLKP